MSDKGCKEITELKDLYELVVMECNSCAFHFGVDASFLEQVGSLKMTCPSCDSKLEISGADE